MESFDFFPGKRKANALVIQSLVGAGRSATGPLKVCEPSSLKKWCDRKGYPTLKTPANQKCDVKIPEKTEKG